MLHLTRGWLFVALMVVFCTPAAGESGFTNMLWNPSFEVGAGTPDGWTGFGFCERDWAFRGRDDSRCLTITADGRTPGWWYASRRPEIVHNALYRLSFWARSGTDGSAESVVVGLNVCDERIVVGPEWRRYEFFFRAPNYLPDAKVCFGEDRLKGTVLFDDVALEPAVAIHRSRGPGGGLLLGDGEEIFEGRYVAVQDLSGERTSDCGFLDSYTAEFHDDRWVLDGLDEVVYRHTLSRLGIALIDNTLVVSDQLKYASGSMGGGSSSVPIEWVRNDPRAERGLLQMPVEVEVDVARLGGKLAVQVCQDGRTWLTAGVIERTGRSTVELPPVIGRAYDAWVRLKSWGDYATEVTHYCYRSLSEGDNQTTAEGASYYVAVLFAPPDLKIGIDDVGELKPDGRNEVKLVLENGRERVHLGCRVMVEGEGEECAYSEEQAEWMAPQSKRRFHLPYAVDDPAKHTIRIMGREVDSGKLLFSLAVRGPGSDGAGEAPVKAAELEGGETELPAVAAASDEPAGEQGDSE